MTCGSGSIGFMAVSAINTENKTAQLARAFEDKKSLAASRKVSGNLKGPDPGPARNFEENQILD